MTRKEFLHRIGIGVAVASLAPVVAKAVSQEKQAPKITYQRYQEPRLYPLTPDESHYPYFVNDILVNKETLDKWAVTIVDRTTRTLSIIRLGRQTGSKIISIGEAFRNYSLMKSNITFRK